MIRRALILAAVILTTGAAPNVWTRKPYGCVYGIDWTGARTTDTTGKAGTLVGNAAISGTALALDGSGDCVSVGDSADLSFTDGSGTDAPFSIVSWVYASDLVNDGQMIACKMRDTPSAAYEYYLRASNSAGATGKPMFAILNSAASAAITVTSSTALPATTWTCVSISYSGSETTAGAKMYINGVEDTSATKATSGTYTGMSNTNAPLLIGSRTDAEYAKGRIGTVIIYNRELSASEVAQFWNAGKARIAAGGTP